MIEKWLELLGVFLRDGVGPARMLVRSVPDELRLLLGEQPDERAIHHDVMTRDVAAYASIYTGVDGLARGDSDHVGARLIDGDPLDWAFPFVVALSHSDSVQHVSAAELLAVVLPEFARLGRYEPYAIEQYEFDSTNIATIVEHLCTPIRCGAYLSTRVLEDVARRVRVPRGFGPRRQQLTHAFRHSGRFGVVDTLVLQLQREIARWDRSYGRLSQVGELEPFIHPWQQRLARTAGALSTMQRELVAARQGQLGRQ